MYMIKKFDGSKLNGFPENFFSYLNPPSYFHI